MATYDRYCIGMHHLNITQTGSAYTGKNSYSHPAWELDLAGEDTGIDYLYNKMENTGLKCLGTFWTSGTYFFGTSTLDGNSPKQVYCPDGKLRVLTLACTHSSRKFVVGKTYQPGEVMYTEGTNGQATGNHIHLEFAEGWQTTKVKNSKGYYNVENMIDARKAMWILDGYTKVVTTKGLEFKHCSEVTYTEPVKPKYDNSSMKAKNNNEVHYRVHQANVGWLSPVHDGMIAGNIDINKRVEAFKLDVSRIKGLDLTVKAHIQSIGWKTYEHITSDTIVGTVGESKRLEAFEIVVNSNPTGKNLYYQLCYNDKKWTDKTTAGYAVGTVSKSEPIVGIRIWME